jgi:heme A synthase
MPSGRVHRRVGRPIGAGYAFARAFQTASGDPLIEAIGGWFGGDAGSSCPDWLEPACWNHRRTAHSFSAGTVIIAGASEVQRWAESCRSRAQHHRLLANNPDLSEAGRLFHSLVAVFWHVLAGWLNGFLAGYISHVILDARTPAGIPIT